jgi:glycosyltransferase involved in cell wall biosynthesis
MPPNEQTTALLTADPKLPGARVPHVDLARPRQAQRPLRVLALASYPEEAAATRQRICQFIGPLAEREIQVDLRPFLTPAQFDALYQRRRMARTAIGLASAMLRRGLDLNAARSADVVIIQREAMLLGPPVCEFVLARLLRKPMVLDLDDATYVAYASPTYGRLTALIKCFDKTDDLIRWSRVVVCGNRNIAAHAALLGAKTVVIPTIVDTDRFQPVARAGRPGLPVLGWIGSHSTFPYLESLFPSLQQLARTVPYRLLVVGSGRDQIDVPGVMVDCRSWRLEREIADLEEFDVGLYPIVADAWALGKSGFKAIQYMSMGLPYVVSPIGLCAEIGQLGQTHFAATTHEDWHAALSSLLRDPSLRARMGDTGRRHALAHYGLSSQVDKLARVLWMAGNQEDRTGTSAQPFQPHQQFRLSQTIIL